MNSIKFECKRCASCCKSKKGETSLIYTDIQNISNYLNINLCDFILNYCFIFERKIYKENGVIDVIVREICLNNKSDVCVLLRKNLCSIQKVKPLICKAYPFIESFEHIQEYQKSLDYCEGFKQGREYSQLEVNQYLKQYNQEYYDGIKPFIKVRFNFKKLFGCEPRNIYSIKLNKNECIIV